MAADQVLPYLLVDLHIPPVHHDIVVTQMPTDPMLIEEDLEDFADRDMSGGIGRSETSVGGINIQGHAREAHRHPPHTFASR